MYRTVNLIENGSRVIGLEKQYKSTGRWVLMTKKETLEDIKKVLKDLLKKDGLSTVQISERLMAI